MGDISMEQRRVHERRLRELEEIASTLDRDNNGYITESEFVEKMAEPRSHLRIFLGVCGVHEGEGLRYFQVLREANSTKRVAVRQFVAGCLKLQGAAQSLDMRFLSNEVQVVHRKLNKLTKAVQRAVDAPNSPRQYGGVGSV